MDANELRALADALEPMAKAPRFEDFDVPAFCAWVRAQADVQPVAAVPAGWKLVPVEPTPEMLSSVGMMDSYDWHAPGCSPDADHANWYSAMIAAAPAAPQGAMLDSHRRLVEQAIQSAEHPPGMSTHDGKAHIDASILRRMLAIIDSAPAVPQAEPKRDQPLLDLLAVIHCDGGHHTEAVGIEQSIKDALSAVCVLKGKLAQAEPKREPLSDERIDEIGDPFGYFQYGDAQGDKRRAFARAVERAAYERAAQECITTAAELRRYADGCTDGRYDWKADGAADCADAISALGRQHD